MSRPTRATGRGGWGLGRGLIYEQFGVQKAEVILGKPEVPPDTFPPLQYPPAKKSEERSLAQSYLLVVKKELLEHLQNSEYNIQVSETSTDVERYSDRYQLLTTEKTPLTLQWSRFPKELRPDEEVNIERRRGPTKRKKIFAEPSPKKRKTKYVDVKEKFKSLEEEEKIKVEDDDSAESSCDVVVVDTVQENEEEVDEEMDEGTDYSNSYFDNGEEYIDNDDDGLEEGGIL